MSTIHLQNRDLMKTASPIKKLFRNIALPIILNKSIVKKMNWLFLYAIDWDEKIK